MHARAENFVFRISAHSLSEHRFSQFSHYFIDKNGEIADFFIHILRQKNPCTHFVTHCATMCYSGAGRGGGFLNLTFVKKMLRKACEIGFFYYFCSGEKSKCLRNFVKFMMSFVFLFAKQTTNSSHHGAYSPTPLMVVARAVILILRCSSGFVRMCVRFCSCCLPIKSELRRAKF